MGKIKLLLAEDDALFAGLLHFRLQKEGFDVHVCKDGKEVKEYLKEQVPNIIASDIMMPYFSGIELISYVRNELNSSIPIIIMSAAGNQDNVLTAFELGANDFITKPINPSELIVRLNKELHKT